VLFSGRSVGLDELERTSGWVAKPEGLCNGDRCVPLPNGSITGHPPAVDADLLAARLGMALVSDQERGVSALGPESGGPVLTSLQAPELELPDMTSGATFALSTLRGKKVVLYAWASW
jgi:hypothetical protein